MPRKPSVKKVKVEPYVNLNTGEIEEFSTYSVPENIKPVFLNRDSIQEKSKEPFFRVNLVNISNLTREEKSVILDLIHMIGWEDNYIQKNSVRLNISELSMELNLSRQYVSRILTRLEENGFLFLQGNHHRKSIYLNPKYVWKGNEKNRISAMLALGEAQK